MEIKIQQCQSCGSRDVRNILVRDESQKVFVQCRQCDQLIARYILSTGGYYHSGKDFESFLRSIERDGYSDSAKDFNTTFDKVKSRADKEFERLKEELKQRYGDSLP